LKVPSALIDSLIETKGFDKEAFENVHQSGEQITSVRFNTHKLVEKSTIFSVENNAEAMAFSSVPWNANGYYLSFRPSFTTDPLFHGGAYYVQEASSMFLEEAIRQSIDLSQPLRVLDLCAAPGGKSTLLQSVISDKSILVSNEVIKSRVTVLSENIIKWGAANVVVTNNDPKDFQRLQGYFDLIVVDAPCSGSGLFRKDPEAIEHWSEDAVQHCSVRQTRIIDDSIDCLKEGGYLIYSTCSYSMQEDENILDKIASIDGMKSIDLNIDNNWGIIQTESPIHNAKGYRFYPDKIKGEGFFLAVFKKETATNYAYYDSNFETTAITKKETEILNSHFALPDNYYYINHQENIIALAIEFKDAYNSLLKNLYVKKMGLAIGTLKGADLIPAHALAMSNWKNLPYQTMELDEATALQYLRRADLNLPGGKGWHALQFKNIRLGWAKLLPNRSNNYYPNDWRILNY
jgi:16S rRNA C967 or C1407 C5-methylase (RsmB/RsmF family)/NOL1/NOP2/fmu family ribosome biogenesis protein